MEQNTILIAYSFNTDISEIDMDAMIQPKLWPTLEGDESFIAVEREIIEWLELNVPETYKIAVESSKRKSHDKILINAIKAKLLLEQSELTGLLPLQKSRFFSLFSPIFENVFKAVKRAQKTHDVRSELIKSTMSLKQNIDASVLYDSFGITEYPLKRVEELLKAQPESEYLNFCKSLILEAELLDDIRRSVELVERLPKDHSNYQTCSCCFRWIRLQPHDRTKIAYHGYKMDRHSNTEIIDQSCIGSKFMPFQISADGTMAAIQNQKNRINSGNTFLDSFKNKNLTRDMQRKISGVKSEIRSAEQYIQYALSKIEANHPSRLDEARNLK
ncbi:hypothetical protein [Acinetobacter sp. ANC 3813]|uniref:hypothetical protein n=1 Tax=Acinetobacter sp. ANC 3813 TaxID=1977873 RepID=UPI000A340DF3|nr:hypothetical protein [Acinetobacter sp. ANC 3813]OTG87869.1 hypothetical protein B9T34_16160 [Acinetobacter sp. ANC 3813]